MILAGYVISGLIALAIILIGLRFLLSPAAAALGYGMPAPSGPTGWLAVKGVRDIVSGLFVILLMVMAPPRLLGEFMLVASLIALGDAVIVLRSGGSRAAAFAALVAALGPGRQEPEVLAEVLWSALHGLVVLVQSGRIPATGAEVRLNVLVEKFGGD